MVRKKRSKAGYRSKRYKAKNVALQTTQRQKFWQYVRWVRQATALANQNLVEDRLIDWLIEVGAPAEQIDYYLGYSKKAFSLAEKFQGYPLELLIDEVKREAKLRGLIPELIEICLLEGIKVKGWVENACYYDRNGLASLEYPEAGGCFCSLPDSQTLVSPEHYPSNKPPFLYRVSKRARIMAEDLNNLIRALLYAVFLTPALRIYYYPLAFFLGVEVEELEITIPTGLEVPAEVPRPWSILLKTYEPKSQVYAEDWNDILDIAEILRIYWAPDIEPFPDRVLPGDTLKSDLYNRAVDLLERIWEKLPKPPAGYVLILLERPPAGPLPPPPGKPPAGPEIPAMILVYAEDWNYGGIEAPGLVFFENWNYSEPPEFTLKYLETWG